MNLPSIFNEKDGRIQKKIWYKYRAKNHFVSMDDQNFYGIKLHALSLNGVIFNNCIFTECSFLSCKMDKTVFKSCTFNDSKFVKIDFSLTNVICSDFNDCSFISCNSVNFGDHYGNYFGEIKNESDLITKRSESESPGKDDSNNVIVGSDSINKVLIRTKKSTTIRGNGRCSVCGMQTSMRHKYKNTNIGEILVCKECQIKLLDRCFGRSDAFFRSIQGGGFSPK